MTSDSAHNGGQPRTPSGISRMAAAWRATAARSLAWVLGREVWAANRVGAPRTRTEGGWDLSSRLTGPKESAVMQARISRTRGGEMLLHVHQGAAMCKCRECGDACCPSVAEGPQRWWA